LLSLYYSLENPSNRVENTRRSCPMVWIDNVSINSKVLPRPTKTINLDLYLYLYLYLIIKR
jgi:hypothetical protein